jgi:4-hydroxy-tetrahydrodipicolinate reductase
VVIIGDGAFGRAIAERATARGIAVHRLLGRRDNVDGSGLTAATLDGVDVVIDASTADAVPANVAATMRAGVPMIVGATGWHDRLDVVREYVAQHHGALLHAANFAAGVLRFTHLLAEAARRFPRRAGYASALLDTHHAAKRDAPSGTARQLAAAIEGAVGTRPEITSLRVGHVPGTHELVLDGPYEQIRIVHEVRDRRLFADGAVDAASWLVETPRAGVFTLTDMLADEVPA